MEGDRRGAGAWAPLAAALLLTALAHAGALRAPLVWDDHHLLGPHGAVARAESWTDLLTARFWQRADLAAGAGAAYVRPLPLLSFRAERALGAGPRAHHATNVVLHLAVCALLFAWARRLGARPWAAGLAVALFGVFPRLTEDVTFVSGRTDLLAAAGVLAALLLHRHRPRDHGLRVAAAAALLLGLLAKEVALAGFVALAAAAWARREPGAAGWRRLGLELLPASTAVALYAGLRLAAGAPGMGSSAVPLGVAGRGVMALQALGYYTEMLATPWRPQLVIGSFGFLEPARAWLGVPAALLLLGTVAALLARRIPARHALWSALAAAALLPVLHLVPISLRGVAADRFLYLPLAGLAAGAALAASRLVAARADAAIAFGVAVALGLAAATARRTRDWQDEVALFAAELPRAHPANGQAHFELANLVARRGDAARAIALYDESLRRERLQATRVPGWRVPAALLANDALVLSEQGRFDEALPVLRELVAQRPDAPLYRLYLGSALARALRFEDADRELGEALRLYPDYALAAGLRRQVRAAAGVAARLPAPTPNEPTAVRADRARVYQAVGSLDRAAELWLAVARAPDATAAELASAEKALAQQRGAVGETPATRALASALADRRR